MEKEIEIEVKVLLFVTFAWCSRIDLFILSNLIITVVIPQN